MKGVILQDRDHLKPRPRMSLEQNWAIWGMTRVENTCPGSLILFVISCYMCLYNTPSGLSPLGGCLVRLIYSAEDGKISLSLIPSSAVSLCPVWLKGPWISHSDIWDILHWSWHPEATHSQESPSAEWGCREEQQDNGEGVVSMLYESGMPTAFWGEALAAFIHTSNRSFTSSMPEMTPHEAFLGSKSDLSMQYPRALESYRTRGDCRGRNKTKGYFSILCKIYQPD